MTLSIDRFGVIERFEGEETRTDFEDMDENSFNEIIGKFESEISLLEQDRDFTKKKFFEIIESSGDTK